MTLHCQAGDIARVTLPDGSIQEFNDTPIEVTVNTIYNHSGMVDIWTDTAYGTWGFYPPIVGVYRTFNWQGSGVLTGDFQPIDGQEGRYFYVKCRGRYGVHDFYGDIGYVFFYQGASWAGFRDSPSSFTVIGNQQPVQPSYQIIIVGNSGSQLLNQSYSTNNYSVECIQGCPPNTLDCGDCCLDCEDILIQVCNIKRMFLG